MKWRHSTYAGCDDGLQENNAQLITLKQHMLRLVMLYAVHTKQ